MIRHLLTCRENIEKTAIIENNTEIPYSHLINKALALHPLLKCEERENIAVLLPNGGSFIAAFWGIISAGMTTFPINPLMTCHEIFSLLKQAHVKTIITSTQYQRLFKEAAGFEINPLNVIYMEDTKTPLFSHKLSNINTSTHEPMVLLNTSGTTDKHKIVELSERNVEASVIGYLRKLTFKDMEKKESRYTLAAPFSSVYGIMILSACLMQSFTIVVLPEGAFTLEGLYRAAERYRITHYEGSTSAILLMEQAIGRPIPYDISSLTYFGTGGSMVLGETIERLTIAYPGKHFYHGYGITEAAPLVSKHPQGTVEKIDSVGTAIEGLEIAVSNGEEIIKTPFIKGEIVVKGPNVMLGYYNDEFETKQAVKDGYLYTGDIGYLDNEGYLYICGRKKSIIIVRGFKVFPEEVEECIKSSRLVSDCIVYGQPDGAGNETVCVRAVPANPNIDKNEIKAFCARYLAEYKQPRKILFCHSINKNVSGKSERRQNDDT